METQTKDNTLPDHIDKALDTLLPYVSTDNHDTIYQCVVEIIENNTSNHRAEALSILKSLSDYVYDAKLTLINFVSNTDDIMHQLNHKNHELGKLQVQERGAIGVQLALSLQTQIANIENDIAELKRELLALGVE